MSFLFVYNNLKVSLNPHDQPYPGFETLTWENETSSVGTLWDLGNDAGMTAIGTTNIYGQLWVTHSVHALTELQDFIGVHTGLFELVNVDVLISDGQGFSDNVKAKSYRLKKIEPKYQIVADGRWIPKRV